MASIDAPQIRPDATLVRLLWVSTLVLPLVLQRESRKRVWEGEDDMGVPDRQQLAFTLREPLIARVRHFRQCRLRHELNEMARCPQAAHRSRCPHSAAGRQCAMARSSRRCCAVSQAR